MSRALTTRKCRGRKSSIVRPSRYCSTTAGETYDSRVTAGVFPRRFATRRMTAVTDVDIFEVSTAEIDDVVRLEDRYGRAGTSG